MTTERLAYVYVLEFESADNRRIYIYVGTYASLTLADKALCEDASESEIDPDRYRITERKITYEV